MKDFTKLIIDLISFGTQVNKSPASIDQMMSCLGGIVFNENLAAPGTVDFDEIAAHLRRCRARGRCDQRPSLWTRLCFALHATNGSLGFLFNRLRRNLFN